MKEHNTTLNRKEKKEKNNRRIPCEWQRKDFYLHFSEHCKKMRVENK